MSPFAKYALFVLLGILIGVGVTAAMIIPKTDALLAQNQKTIEAQGQQLIADQAAMGAAVQAMQKVSAKLEEAKTRIGNDDKTMKEVGESMQETSLSLEVLKTLQQRQAH